MNDIRGKLGDGAETSLVWRFGVSTFEPNADVVKAHRAYVDAINSNKTDRVMACYDEDAEIMQPDGELVAGFDKLRKWVCDYFAAYKTTWRKESKVIWVAGDYGFDQGVDHGVDEPRTPGQPVQTFTVKGILIYKRQKTGEFKVYRDIWNFNSPPTLTRS